jgi:Flp pilus assembly pilin Flp
MLGNQRGQGMVEYILIVALVVVGGIAIWTSFGKEIGNLITRTSDKIEAVK